MNTVEMSCSRSRYRRSPHLMVYWDGDQLVLHNYATGSRVVGSPLVVRIMSSLTDWRTFSSIAGQYQEFGSFLMQQMLDRLEQLTLVQRSDRARPRTEPALATWKEWAPEAAFFHLSTKDVAFDEPAASEEALSKKVKVEPCPSRLKRFRGATPVTLPPLEPRGELSATLLARRTWRRFGPQAVQSTDLSTLLGLTWGVQKWAKVDGQGTVALKTAPSGGARHNLEAYALVVRAEGIEPGLYHYDANAHALQVLRRNRGVPADIASYIPKQPWYDGAAILVLMTAVFGRAQWRYTYPRAYRSVLLEAGHFCQNFCLVATSLGLAPFCTAALADSLIERDLGIDGVTESVIYACGVGSRPPGTDWAPWPDTTDVPALIRPKSAANPALTKR